MSVRTTYDERLDHAREKLEEAYYAVSRLIDKEVWGYDDMNDRHKQRVIKVLAKLLVLKEKL